MNNNAGQIQTNDKIACVTLDLETDHGPKTRNYFAHEHVCEVARILSRLNIPLTVFVTGEIIESNLPIIDDLMKIDAEFELHCYDHRRQDTINDIKKSIKIFEKRFNKRPLGYRGFLYVISDDVIRFLIDEGFRYDSSCVPSFRPFVYNNIREQRKPYFIGDTRFLEIPVSTFPFIRYPVTMSYLQLIGKINFMLLDKLFKMPEPLIFEFHMHDIFLTQSVNELPALWQRLYFHNHKSGGGALNMFSFILERIISKQYRFVNLKSLYNLYIKNGADGFIS